VVTLNRAVAVSKTAGPEAALEMVEALAGKLDGYFYFHGTRGVLLKELGRFSEARTAFDRAIALANTPAEAAHIRSALDQLDANLGASQAKNRKNSDRKARGGGLGD